jgi:CheY-like chemotaxis protein
LRILVAEDDIVMSKFVCSVLRSSGHQPTPVFDFVQALMLAKREPQPEAIILDLSMPAGSGLGVLEKLKTSFKTSAIPVIILTGTTDDATRESALAAGAVAFVAKPVSQDDVLNAVAEAGKAV